MKKILLKLFMLFLSGVLSISFVIAQESINSSGGNAIGTNGTISYSIGQIVYQTHTSANGSITEGVQQPFEISVVTNIEEAKDINILVSAYPNPTIDYLTLEVKNFDIKNLYFQLYDMQGKLLQNKKITDNRTNIVMNNLVSSIYFIKLIQNNKEIKTFKIIKN